MSNTSYSFKENSHMKVIQGGEKKVMKKILSVALSTAMAFSMFASVAFGADAKLTPEQQFNVLKEAGIVTGYPDGTAGLEKSITRAELAKIIVKSIGLDPVTGVASYKDKNYTTSHWAAPYIEAATQQGLLEGKDAVKKLFDPTGNVTVQELAKVLTLALDLEVPADATNTASDWAKGFVAAAIKGGYIAEGTNYQANATRSQTIVAAHAIYEFNNFKVTKAEATDATHVKLTLSTGEVVDVVLEKALEANKATELTYKAADGRELKYTVTWAVDAATKVVGASASNLKEIVVEFDGKVDEDSAENIYNYSIEGKDYTYNYVSGQENRFIYSATLSEDQKHVTLVLAGDDRTNILPSQRETYVQVNNVKTGDGVKTISQKVSFTPLDVTAPEVKEVTALGTKAIQIVFSEPVQKSYATDLSNYRIDEKITATAVQYLYPNTVILTASVTEGDHYVRVNGVRDFSGLVVVPVQNNFKATVDATAATIVSAKTSDLKNVTVEFSEPVKSIDTVTANVSTIKATSKTQLSANKWLITFADNTLRYTDNILNLTAVKDYSGNSANLETSVVSTLDTTRPEVISHKFYQETKGGDYIAEVQFSKPLKEESIKNRANYVLKTSGDKIPSELSAVNLSGNPVRTPEFVSGTGNRTVKINFGANLPEDTYKLTVSGLQDTAWAPNYLLSVTLDLNIADAYYGQIVRAYTGDSAKEFKDYVYVRFDKNLATSGEGNVLKAEKYVVKTTVTSSGTSTYQQLTNYDSDVELVNSNTVRIYNRNKATVTETSTTKSYVVASYIADANGRLLNSGNINYSTPTDSPRYTLESPSIVAWNSATSVGITKAEVTSKNKLVLTTSEAIESLASGSFSVKHSVTSDTYAIKDVTFDKKTVTLEFSDSNALPVDFAAGDLVFALNAGYTSVNAGYYYDGAATLNIAGSAVIADKVAPEFKSSHSVLNADGTYSVVLEFTQNVYADRFPGGAVEAADLFKASIDNKALNNIGVTYAGKTVTITGTTDVAVAPGRAYIHNVRFDENNNVNTVAKVLVDNQNNSVAKFEAAKTE